jgi:exopolyphosphatase/guanosine-5'-triphosphate,3'-diphosphate pyrophosphatase
MRVAVVDIGSNSTRLLIAEVPDDSVSAELVRRTEVTRLGDGVDANGELRDDAMERVFKVLDSYRSEIEACGCDRSVAVLTSAVRDASNGEEFASVVHDRFGLESHVLSGDEEAQFTYLGATGERTDDGEPTLVIDIGGGSTELVIGVGQEMTFHVSTQAGVVRQTERHIGSDPPLDSELEALAEDVRAILFESVPASVRSAVKRGIAVAGTATSLAAIAQSLDPYDPAKVHGYVVGAGERDSILDRLVSVALDERREVVGLHPDRAPTIVAGVVILAEVMNVFGLTEIEISEHDILRGAAAGLTREDAR